MAFESITDDIILDLVNCPKRIKNPNAREKTIEGSKQTNYRAISEDEFENEFEIYKRQNAREGMHDDFSCGIKWIAPDGNTLTLRRYNGFHSHKNVLEKERLNASCHVHYATEKYLKANRKEEGYANTTEDYSTLEGAFHCLVTDCKISGISTNPDVTNQTKLFD